MFEYVWIGNINKKFWTIILEDLNSKCTSLNDHLYRRERKKGIETVQRDEPWLYFNSLFLSLSLLDGPFCSRNKSVVKAGSAASEGTSLGFHWENFCWSYLNDPLQTLFIKRCAYISVWRRLDAANPFQRRNLLFYGLVIVGCVSIGSFGI